MHLRKINTLFALQVLRNVDNILFYASGTEEAKKRIDKSLEMFKSMGMNLRDYATSEDTGKDQKLLGYYWNTSSDEIQLNIKETVDEAPSKRGFLRAVAKIYDPLGLIQPALFRAKLLIQNLSKD